MCWNGHFERGGLSHMCRKAAVHWWRQAAPFRVSTILFMSLKIPRVCHLLWTRWSPLRIEMVRAESGVKGYELSR